MIPDIQLEPTCLPSEKHFAIVDITLNLPIRQGETLCLVNRHTNTRILDFRRFASLRFFNAW